MNFRRPKAPKRPASKQVLSEDLMRSLLNLIETKFYPGHRVAFEKDRPRLVPWVVTYLARWLDAKALTLPPDRYFKIMSDVLIAAHAHFAKGNVRYMPGYLKTVLQRYLRHHGEPIHNEAKNLRTVLDHVVKQAGAAVQRAPDPVRDLATVGRLMQVAKGRRPLKAAAAGQRELGL